MSTLGEGPGYDVSDYNPTQSTKNTDSVSTHCLNHLAENEVGPGNVEHNEGVACEILCTVSISPILIKPIYEVPANTTEKWVAEDKTQRVNPLAFSLFKPPRS